MRGGGGFRSSGGGFRSGGFHSSGFRSSGFSSHNHYGARPHYHRSYRPHYYGRPPYRRYGGYYGGGGGGACCGTIFFCIFFMIFIGIAITSIGFTSFNTGWNTTSSSSSSGDDPIELNSQDTVLSTISADASKMSVTSQGGTVYSYFFISKPSLTVTIEDAFSIEDNSVQRQEYRYFTRYLNTGSQLHIIWNSSSYIDFYVLKGTDQMSDFDNDYYFDYEVNDYDNNYDDTFTVSESDIYYFVFWSSYYDQTFDVFFDMSLKQYDTSTADSYRTGSFDLDLTDNNYNYVVFENPSATGTASLEYSISQGFFSNTANIILIVFIAVVVIAVVAIIAKKKDKKTAPTTTPGMQTGQPIQSTPAPQFNPSMYGQSSRSSSPNYGGTSSTTMPQTEQTYKSSTNNQPMTMRNSKSTKRFCHSCGTELDDDTMERLGQVGSVFCKYCGAKIEKNL